MNIRLRTILIAVVSAVVVAGLAACASRSNTNADAEVAVFADLKQEIAAVVDDADREQRAMDLVDELQDSYDRLLEAVTERQEALRALNRDYDAPREAFARELELLETAIEDNEIRMTGIRRALVDVLTADEWREMEKVRARAVERALRSGQAI